MRPQDDETEIENTDAHIQPKTPEDYEQLCLTHQDRVFLHGCGAGLYALSYREDKREFDELLKRDWEEFERRFGKEK